MDVGLVVTPFAPCCIIFFFGINRTKFRVRRLKRVNRTDLRNVASSAFVK